MSGYSGGLNARMPDGVAYDTLDESYVSVNDGLVFPNVQSCMALVLRGSPQGMVAGYHCTIATTREELQAIAGPVTAQLGRNFSELYLLGSVSLRKTGQSVAAESRFRRPLKRLLREVFGYDGVIRYFDTSSVNKIGWVFSAWRDPRTNLTCLAGGEGGTIGARAAPFSLTVRMWHHGHGRLAEVPNHRRPRLCQQPATSSIPLHGLAVL